MELLPLNLLGCSTTLLLILAVKSNRRLPSLILWGLTINLLLLWLFLFANHFSKSGIDEAVVAHLKHVFNFASLKLFWIETLVFLIGLGLIPISIKALTKMLVRLQYSPSHSLTKLANLLAIPCVALTILTNPLLIGTKQLIDSRNFNARFELPSQFSDVSFLAPDIKFKQPAKHSDFVIIIAESLEKSFIEADKFPELTPELTHVIEQKAFQNTGIKELSLSNWTDSALTSIFCGLSLTPQYLSSKSTEKYDEDHRMIVGESCIGNVLSEHYELEFWGSSDFGADTKQRLFTAQEFDSIKFSKEALIEYPESIQSTKWGLYDEHLFNQVLQRLKQQRTTPFGLVILSVDTHLPGYVSPSCEKNPQHSNQDQLLRAIHCSSAQIAKLINQILEDDAAKDTTIILLTDHLLPGELPQQADLERADREYLFATFNSQSNYSNEHQSSRRASPYDIAPTILAHLGYQLDTFNLGRNLLGPEPTLAETLGMTVLSNNVVTIRKAVQQEWSRLQNKNSDDAN